LEAGKVRRWEGEKVGGWEAGRQGSLKLKGKDSPQISLRSLRKYKNGKRINLRNIKIYFSHRPTQTPVKCARHFTGKIFIASRK
jgi:hypothetical protein